MNDSKVAPDTRSAGSKTPFSRPSARPSEIGLALAIGAAGGTLFWLSGLPLPWMLGSMFFSMLAALARLPAALPVVVRNPMMMVIGVMLGATFRPEVFAQASQWWPSFLGMAVLLLISAAINVAYLHRIAGLDRTTAFFAGVPGGLAEMIAIGSQRGGDAATIALLHSARIFFVVFTFSFLLDAVSGDEAATVAARASLADTSLADFLWFAFCLVAGLHIGRLLRLPGYYLVGPMLVSAAVHVVGASHFEPPGEIVGAAQVVLGASIGLSFAGRPVRELARVLAISMGSVALLVCLTAVAALLVHHAAGLHFGQLMLAYAPGGLAEMSIVAMALGFEVAFVAAHHVTRIFVVVLCAPLAERWLHMADKDFKRER